MTTSWFLSYAAGFVICLVQFLAALPWACAIAMDPQVSVFQLTFLRRFVPKALGALLLAAVVPAVFFQFQKEPELLHTIGRIYGSVLYLQLSLDFFAIVFGLLLLVWPRGAAVAMAAFREGVRQPLFWFCAGMALLSFFVMPFVPYFTFGEDLKMVKELGYDVMMLAPGVFAVLAAAISISEEIEGRTAITLMSKPVSRRQFLLGKFFGILMAALLMTALLSLAYLFVLWFKPIYDRDPFPPPAHWLIRVAPWERTLGPAPTYLLGGVVWWSYDVVTAYPGVILGFCQVMVLLAIAVALATRLPMVVNLVICLTIFFLGHLTPVLAQVSQNRFPLVRFVAQLFDVLLPGLDLFNIGPVLTRADLPPAAEFSRYIGSVSGYALIYTAIALLFGLILFEDRDLA
jgi:hypothetical protein